VLQPILRWLRPLAPGFAQRPLSQAKPTGVSSSIDGDACEEFELGVGPDLTEYHWLAVDKDYVPRRITVARKGVILFQTDIGYAISDISGWQPSSWVTNQFDGKGELQMSEKVEVVAMNLNTPQPDDRFEMQFPPETDYFDATDGNKSFHVQDNGLAKRTEHMYGEELAETKVQTGDSWFRAHRWTLSLGLGAVCGCVLLIAYRGWRGRQAA
jgi:hypothetical protein